MMAQLPNNLGITIRLNRRYDEAVAQVMAALKAQGFGILTEIDVQATLRQKLGVEMDHYLILGACNPPLAHRTMQTEPQVGLLLPCNVIVYQQGATDETTVSIVDPLAMMQMADNPALAAVAHEAHIRLQKVAAALQA